MNKLEKKYGLPMAICMVVGIVIGSGVFFKAQDVLSLTGGNALDGVIAWLIGGAVMLSFAATFAVMATKYEKNNGVMDYAEATCGGTYTYFVGWFLSIIYYPSLTAVLCWLCGRYSMVAFFGESANSPEALYGSRCIALSLIYMITVYAINVISPKIAGKLQVSTTAVKLIPLAVIALVGTVAGAFNGTLVGNFSYENAVGQGHGGLFGAVCCTAFAYEGWIGATSINAEIKNSKRNLPLALLIGSGIVVAAYVLYYIGILGLVDGDRIMEEGTNAAFGFFGSFGSWLISFLIVFSCLGTLNGLTVGCTRGLYSLAVRDEGPDPERFSEIDPKSNMPTNSAVVGLLLTALWFAYFVGAQFYGWFGAFAFDSSELAIITIYAIYVPMLIMFMVKSRELGIVKRFVLPSLSLIGAGIMIAASIFRHGMDNVYYLIVFSVIMLLGIIPLVLNRRRQRRAADSVSE